MDHLQDAAIATPADGTEQRTAARLRRLAVALFVPVAVTLLGIAPYAALPLLDSADRALVWVEGDHATLARVAESLEAESAFSGGIAGGRLDGIPDGCAAGASRLHFDVSRAVEAQVAREALEQLATAAGARVCATHRFELGRADDPLGWTPFAAALALPLTLLFALRLASIEPRPRRPAATPIAALVLAVGVVAIAPVPAITVPFPVPAVIASALALALVHEAAFRGWLLARAIPVLGLPAATTLSIATSTMAAIAVDGIAGATAAAAIAAICSATYLRTRSTMTCVAVHAIAAAVIRATTG